MWDSVVPDVSGELSIEHKNSAVTRTLSLGHFLPLLSKEDLHE